MIVLEMAIRFSYFPEKTIRVGLAEQWRKKTEELCLCCEMGSGEPDKRREKIC